MDGTVETCDSGVVVCEINVYAIELVVVTNKFMSAD